MAVISPSLSPQEEALHPKVQGRWSKKYAQASFKARTTVELLFALLTPLLGGFIVFALLLSLNASLFTYLFWGILGPLLLTSLMILIECARAARFPEPALATVPEDQLPTLAVIVPAYLPNEAETLLESLRCHLAQAYPEERLVVVCAYNGESETLEEKLYQLQEEDSRFIALRVEHSSSKAENLNAAIALLKDRVEVAAIFDADHHVHPLAARRAVRWLSPLAGEDQFDLVQGQCSIRNVNDSFTTKLVAAEFVTIYAVAHPGRTVFNDFGIFGGSNGWWRMSSLAQLEFDSEKLTEDIDATARALKAGFKLATDPRILSTELAPQSWSALWQQRMRWAQGWLQVSRSHTFSLLKNRKLSSVQKRGVLLLFAWRVLHPWVAALMLPLMAAKVLILRQDAPYDLLIFMLTTVIVLGVGIPQALLAARLAPPSMRNYRGLFFRYALLSPLYAGVRSFSNRAAILRELLHHRQWAVTPRTNK